VVDNNTISDYRTDTRASGPTRRCYVVIFEEKNIVNVELLRSAQIDADNVTDCREFDSKLPSCDSSNGDVSKRNRRLKLR
jgi:hypothetical protein